MELQCNPRVCGVVNAQMSHEQRGGLLSFMGSYVLVNLPVRLTNGPGLVAEAKDEGFA